MKILIKSVLILILVSAGAMAAGKTYRVSSIDINTITCPAGEVATDIFFSEKAPLKVENRKNKVFFEFEATKQETASYDGRLSAVVTYATDPVTVALFCNDNEYNITLVPEQLKSGVSINLEKTTTAVMSNMFDGLKREEQLSTIISQIFTNNEIRSFKKENVNYIDNFNNVNVYYRHKYTGGGYIVKELYLYAPETSTVNEDDLLSLDFINFPTAISLLDNRFSGWSRAVVII